MKKTRIGESTILALLAAPALAAGEPAGYALLDRFVVQFEQMARAGSGTSPDAALAEMMAMARKARAENRIETAFFDRYARLLRVLKLVTMNDPEGLLRPVADREVGDFVQNVLGERKTDIGSLAQAMTRELESLRKGLDAK